MIHFLLSNQRYHEKQETVFGVRTNGFGLMFATMPGWGKIPEALKRADAAV